LARRPCTQLRKTAEAAIAALQKEQKKTVALTNDLATARRDLETKAALSSKAGDETAQLRKTAEAATAALQEEQKKTVALASIEPTKTPDRTPGAEAKPNAVAPVSGQLATSGSKADSQAAHLMARAQSLLSQGDINGARIFLETGR
jgi:ribonucleotide monophosphatase NagD (HAD superfamily)